MTLTQQRAYISVLPSDVRRFQLDHQVLGESRCRKAGFWHCSIVFCATLTLGACGWWPKEEKRNEPSPAKALDAEKIEPLASLSIELDQLQRDVQVKNEEISKTLQKYQKIGGQLPPQIGADLTDEQRELLNQKIKQERLSLRNLLQEVLEKDREISDLKFNMLRLQSQLPDFVTAKEGDSHDRIAMDFLVEEMGLAEKKAWGLVSQINLQRPLVPGFRVWMYYEDSHFGTWVTQGTARLGPQEIQERIRQELELGRDEAIAIATYMEGQAEDLKLDVAFLEKTRRELQKHVDTLVAEEEAILAQLMTVKTSLAQAANATRYLVGSKKQLKESGIISTSLFKGMRLKSLEGFELLDLGESTEIILDGSVYGLSRVKKVTLLPKVFQKGTDFEVYKLGDGEFTRVEFLNPDKFRQFKFVVVLE